MAPPSNAVAAANDTDLHQYQRAGFLVLALIPADGKDVRCGSQYRLELVEKRKRAILKGRNGCACYHRSAECNAQIFLLRIPNGVVMR